MEQAGKAEQVSTADRATAWRIVYRTTFVPNPSYQPGEHDLFSEELLAEIRRSNVSERRVVHVDGQSSRSEEINVDYSVRSPSFELRSAGSAAITFCKEYRFFNFCLEYPSRFPVRVRPPSLSPLPETATIAGLRCRKGEYTDGLQRMHVWSTDEASVADPTGAVLHLEGVPGLILQTEEIADSSAVDVLKRVTVEDLRLGPAPPGIFSAPAGYRRFPDLAAVRAEDRRILDERAAEEQRLRPLGDQERERYVGAWRLDRPHDAILVEIRRASGDASDGEYRFRTEVLTAPATVFGRVTDERAFLKGRLMMVEEPPNYRLYALGDGGRSLILLGNELFTFTRR